MANFFTVETSRSGGFPLSMLRFDEAWPESDDDAIMIETLIRGDDAEIIKLPRRVRIRLGANSRHAPSGRWGSFMVDIVQDPR